MTDPVTGRDWHTHESQLAALTTLRVGGLARRIVVAETEAALITAVGEADTAGEPVLVLGGGSNVLISDDGFDGTVVLIRTRGVSADDTPTRGMSADDTPTRGVSADDTPTRGVSADDTPTRGVSADDAGGSALVTVAAGESWDGLVAHAVAQGWSGLEALSGIPGLVGATPIQNVGAYGSEVSHTLVGVRAIDRTTGAQAILGAAECGFGYRWSRFKAEPGRWLVLEVTFRLPIGQMSAPIRYAELARTLGVAVGERAEMAAVREAVLDLRRGKGMVLDETDHDTWSAGSFFTNPIVPAAVAAELPENAPRFPADAGRVKTSAAWLIDQAGFAKGFGADVGQGRATLSTKHTLALTNRGHAHAGDIVELARVIRAGVAERFGITLVPEPVLLGCEL